MSVERTPPLSLEDSAVIWEEMSRPPEDTPERRAMFKLMDEWAERRKRNAALDQTATGQK